MKINHRSKIILPLCLLLLFWVKTAGAYVIDGDLTDWGVTPFTDWVPTRSSVDYVVEDNFARYGSDPFEERYDIEAMYFDDRICPADGTHWLFFAIVQSDPHNLISNRDDLGIDFSGQTFDQLFNNAPHWQYGVDFVQDHLGPMLVDLSGTNPDAGRYNYRVYDPVGGWVTYHEINPTIDAPFKMSGGWNSHYWWVRGTVLGRAEVVNRYAGPIEPGDPNDPDYYPNTYIIEGRLDAAMFPEFADLVCGSPIELYFSKVTCVKDYISLRATLDGTCGAVPEPSTLILLGGGLLAAAFRRKKKI